MRHGPAPARTAQASFDGRYFKISRRTPARNFLSGWKPAQNGPNRWTPSVQHRGLAGPCKILKGRFTAAIPCRRVTTTTASSKAGKDDRQSSRPLIGEAGHGTASLWRCPRGRDARERASCPTATPWRLSAWPMASRREKPTISVELPAFGKRAESLAPYSPEASCHRDRQRDHARVLLVATA